MRVGEAQKLKKKNKRKKEVNGLGYKAIVSKYVTTMKNRGKMGAGWR